MREGTIVRIKEDSYEGRMHQGELFVVDGEVRELCGTCVVALANTDGTRFSAAYDFLALERVEQ